MDINMHDWHTEEMIYMRMREIEHEVEENRLIKDAGLAKPGLLERTGTKLGVALTKISQNMRARRISQRQAYQETSCKLAS